MKRSLLAVAAVLALGSVPAFAQAIELPQPSFNDAPDLTPSGITGMQTFDQNFPKGTMDSGGPKGPATVVFDANDRVFAQQAAAGSSTLSDAVQGDGRPYHTLNDAFGYPAY